MLNVRLKASEEKKLADYCQRSGRSKTEVVREALAQYLQSEVKDGTPYELGVDLFGADGSEDRDLSRTYKERMKQKLNAKYSH